MKRPLCARRLDVVDLARAGESLSGHSALHEFARLAKSVRAGTEEPVVDWVVHGEQRAANDGVQRPAFELCIETALPLSCQRCLERVVVALHVDRHFIFAPTEAQAARLDAESTDDVLVLRYPFDLLRLVEDELILALPMVPHHESCERPLPAQSRSDGFEETARRRRSPFGELAKWRAPQSR